MKHSRTFGEKHLALRPGDGICRGWFSSQSRSITIQPEIS